MGIIREKIDDISYTELTQFTCARDPNHLRYYIKSYDAQNIKMIDLTEFNLNASDIKSLTVKGITQIDNVSSQLN